MYSFGRLFARGVLPAATVMGGLGYGFFKAHAAHQEDLENAWMAREYRNKEYCISFGGCPCGGC